MNPYASQSISFASIIKSLHKNKTIIFQMIKKEIKSKYKGSFLGFVWSFLTPILMLLVYTFVFSVVFNARWPAAHGGLIETKTNFAVFLFIGLLIHGMFAEIVSSSTSVIESHVNLVKKVVFPLEILNFIKAGAAIFNFSIGILVLLIAFLFLNIDLHLTIIYLPIVIFPLILLAVGLAWVTSSLCVYARDIAQPINILMTVMLFLSPVFFPVSSVPENYKTLIELNPLTFIIEQARLVLVMGINPDFYGLLTYFIFSLMMLWVGYVWFQKTKKGFADVI